MSDKVFAVLTILLGVAFAITSYQGLHQNQASWAFNGLGIFVGGLIAGMSLIRLKQGNK